VGALDLKAPAAGQLALYQEIALVLRGLTFWLARKAAKGAPRVQKLIDAYRPTADALIAEGGSLLSPFENAAAAARMRRFMEAGAPADLAEAVAALRPQTTAVDIADLAAGARWDAPQTARLYHAVGEAFGFERLRAAAAGIAARDDYERQAVRELVLEIANEQAARVRAVMAGVRRGPHDVRATIASWIEPRKASVDRGLLVIADIEAAADGWSFPKLSIATAAVKAAAASSSSV
jgi:glutamate dehydrogenase